jgi:hypothetical protein
MRLFLMLLILSCTFSALGQARRITPQPTAAATNQISTSLSVKEMFDEANAYNKKKFAEFEQKKIPVSDSLIQQTQRERKQLAARYAADRPDKRGNLLSRNAPLDRGQSR